MRFCGIETLAFIVQFESSQCMNALSSGPFLSSIRATVEFFLIILRRQHIYVLAQILYALCQ